MRNFMATLGLLLAGGSAFAGEVEVVAAKAQAVGGTFSFSVTLKHGDAGWKHYADKWEVLAPDGMVLGTRVLYHPHVNEQPFTRGLSGVKVPAGIKSVRVRAHDRIHGDGPRLFEVKLPGR